MVAAVHAPPQTLTTRPVDVVVEVSEANGETGATATVELTWGPSLLGSKSVDVGAGRTEAVRFEGVALTTAAQVELTAHVKGAVPGETDDSNNVRAASVDVSEHELVPARVLIPSIAGFGARFNQHVYAPLPLTGLPPAAFGDLETKVKALEPQLVRIFYNDDWEELRATAPQNLESFMKRSSWRMPQARRSTSPTSRRRGRVFSPPCTWAGSQRLSRSSSASVA